MEVNLRPDGQTGPTLTGAELMTWLMHQAAHGIVGPVTGQEGRYHGPAYRDAAEGLGLEVQKAPTGYGATELAPGTRARYRPGDCGAGPGSRELVSYRSGEGQQGLSQWRRAGMLVRPAAQDPDAGAARQDRRDRYPLRDLRGAVHRR